MKLAAAVLERIDNSLNPIVVKELRQAVQGKFVLIVLILFLVVQLCVMGTYLMYAEPGDDEFEMGRTLFHVLRGILAVTCLLFVPAYTAVRLSAERSSTNVDLMFITTIRPRAIIWGKFLAAMILTVLIFSTCLPFVSLTYLLRGVDLPTIFIVLAFDFLVVAAMVQLGIFGACIPGSTSSKAFHALIGLGILISVVLMAIGAPMAYFEMGVGSYLWTWEFWATAGTVLALGLLAMGLLFVLSVALISPPSSNRMLPMRIYLPVMGVAGGVLAVLWARRYGRSMAEEPIMMWVGALAGIFCVTLFTSVSERHRPGPRVASRIPRRFLLRWLAFPFYTGAGSAVVWSVLMIAATLGVGWLLQTFFCRDHDLQLLLEVMLGMALYSFAYAMTGLLLRNLIFSRQRKSAITAAVALSSLMIGSIVPPVVAFLSSSDRFGEFSDSWWLGNPFALIAKINEENYRKTAIMCAAGWAAIVAVMNIPWLIDQLRHFKPLRKKERPTALAPETVERAADGNE